MLSEKRTFTLVELLVVVAIVGLISIIAVIALTSARKKSRDSARVAAMRQIQVEMERVFSEGNTYNLAGCTAAGAKVSSCATPLSNYLTGIAKLKDPVSDKTCTVLNGACTDKAPCDYAVAVDPDTSTYKFCFYLEGAVGDLFAGMHYVSPGGVQ